MADGGGVGWVPAGSSPPLPRLGRRRWTDARLLLGVLLVVASLATGARVMAGAERTGRVWAASRDLAAGLQLTAADVQVREVRLGAASGNYLTVGSTDPVGRLLTRPVSAGDLLPAAAVVGEESAADRRRLVTVPVSAFHYPPDLARGAVVDVYVSAGPPSADLSAGPGGAGAVPSLAIAGAVVLAVTAPAGGFAGPDGSVGVVLSVPSDQVPSLVAGVRAGPVDLVQAPQP